MKNKYTIAGMILTVVGLAFVAVAMTNPQFSFSGQGMLRKVTDGICLPDCVSAHFHSLQICIL